MDHHAHTTSCLNCKLAALCLPYGLNPNEITHLTNIIEPKRPLQLDEFLYHQGESCQNLYAIKSGSFKSIVTTVEGVEQIIGFYLPGELMGLEALQNGRYSCSSVALETAAVCELPIERLNSLCNEINGLQLQLNRILGKEISSVHANILLVGHRSAKERIATFILMLASRYAALGFSNTHFNLTMRRQDIANFLGLTLETVSRQLTALSTQGVITLKHRDIAINNLPQLQAIVQTCQPL